MTPTLPFIAHRKDARPVEKQVEQVVQAYLTCAAWSDELGSADWAPESIELARFEVTAFLHLAKWNVQDWPLDQLGHDFWLTRNGHGTGFWDRDIGTEAARQALTDLSKVFGERDSYVGDDGLIYFS